MAKQRLASLASYQRSTIHEIDEEERDCFLDFHARQSATSATPSVTSPAVNAQHSPYSTNNSSIDTDYFSSGRQLDKIVEHDDKFYDTQTEPDVDSDGINPLSGTPTAEEAASSVNSNTKGHTNHLKVSPHTASNPSANSSIDEISMLCKPSSSSSMDQEYLLLNNTCRSSNSADEGFCVNGGIQMNIFGSSDDTLNLAQTPTATDSSAATTSCNLAADQWPYLHSQSNSSDCVVTSVNTNLLTVETACADNCSNSVTSATTASNSSASATTANTSSPNHLFITNNAATSNSSSQTGTGINTNGRKSPASFHASATNRSAAISSAGCRAAAAFYNSGSSPNQSFSSSASAPAYRSRQRFAHNRSVSTDVPSRQRRSPVEPGSLSRPGSGQLLRINSFDRGTQTAPKFRNSLVRLNIDHKQQPRYESAISVIGTEYMKASGAIGIKFPQLQKPGSQDKDSVSGSVRLLNYDYSEHKSAVPLTSIEGSSKNTGDKQTANPMSNCATGTDSHVVKLNTAEDDQGKDSFSHHIGYRLGRRKQLAERRRKLADLCCIFALIGLVLMVIETECSIAKAYTKDDAASYILKSLITVSTLVLLILIAIYHAVEIQLFVVDNCIEDWRIAMSWQRILQVSIELLICSIHPVPISYHFNWTIYNIKKSAPSTASVPIDLVFSLPMFLRLYLLVRVMLLHSKLFTDASSRSIGALNKITFDNRFVLKTLMTIFPGTVMVVFMFSLWIVCAWTLRACESYFDPLLSNFLNTLYLIAITFLSVGYGDFYPYTYCGRTISIVSGLMGAGCTALVVAVIARKLELTRAEKHVHNFMLENQLAKKLKDAAANVLRETWLIYKYTKLTKRVNAVQVRAHQRKFLKAIQSLRLVKMKQRKLTDQASSLTDFAKTTNQVHDIVSELRCNQTTSESRMAKVEKLLFDLQLQVDAIPHTVADILTDRQLSTTSFVSAHDMSVGQSPVNHRRLHPGMATSAQSSFDSYG